MSQLVKLLPKDGSERRRPSGTVMYLFPLPAGSAAPRGYMRDPWHCVRAGCISQDIPGPTACAVCINWVDGKEVNDA